MVCYANFRCQDFIDYWTSKGAVVKIRPMCTWLGKTDRNIMIKLSTDRKPCYWAMTTMPIAHTGQVVGCACDLGAEITNGNVAEKSIKEIWNTTLKEFRLKHLEGCFDELDDFCRNCPDWRNAGSIKLK